MGRDERNEDDFALLEERLRTYTRGIADANYRRVESLLGIYHSLNIGMPLPPMVGYAMSADTGVALVTEILAGKPGTILELGSGVSTLLAAYSLAKNGAGLLVSLEHNSYYLERTYQDLVDHGVEAWVDLVHAPLVEVELDRGPWRWYDLSQVELPEYIDLLVVDGPPAHLQSQSRYPALPLLHGNLADDATILLDDAARDEEREAARAWMTEFPEFKAEPLASLKGAMLLRRSTQRA